MNLNHVYFLSTALFGLLLSAGCDRDDVDASAAGTSSEGMSAKAQKKPAKVAGSQPSAADGGMMKQSDGGTEMAVAGSSAANTPAAASHDAGAGRSAANGGGSAGRAAADSSGREPAHGSGGAAGSSKQDGLDAGADELCDGSAPEKSTFWLVIDGSGSMLNPLGDTTRWQAMKQALLDPTTGLIKRFEHDVQWGLMIYDGSLGTATQGTLPDGGIVEFEPTTMCPRIVSVSSAVDNYATISAAFTQYPLGGSTPTHMVLQALLEQLPADPEARSHTSIVLATDGEPNDLCNSNVGGFEPPLDVRPFVIDAVAKAAASNVKTYVINLAPDDAMLTEHLAQVAKAGATGQSAFAPGDQAALSEALKNIVGSRPGCTP